MLGRRATEGYGQAQQTPGRGRAATGRAMRQTARVRVDDETWAEYRRLLGERSLAEALGSHVEREVARAQRERATQAQLNEREVLEALERVEAAGATLETLAGRLQHRVRLVRPG